MIRVINLRNYELKPNEILVKVDRSSPLGNPFVMRTEIERAYVCIKYERYINNILAKDIKDMKESELKVLKELSKILELAEKYDIALACWCAPKRCHAEYIKAIIERALEVIKNKRGKERV